jgi:hypothetical protein
MSAETKKQSFQILPWEDSIDWGACLEAIHNDDTALLAQYLRTPESIDRRIILKLVDLLDPKDPKLSRYVLKKASGRPRKSSPVYPDDPIEILLDKADPKDIADYLSRSENPDRRIFEWLADRLDRSTADGSHFVVKQPRGKPPRQSRWQTLLVGEQYSMRMLGLKVELKLRDFKKYHSALHHFTQVNNDWPHRVSLSKARRAHQLFLKAKSLPKKQ